MFRLGKCLLIIMIVASLSLTLYGCKKSEGGDANPSAEGAIEEEDIRKGPFFQAKPSGGSSSTENSSKGENSIDDGRKAKSKDTDKKKEEGLVKEESNAPEETVKNENGAEKVPAAIPLEEAPEEGAIVTFFDHRIDCGIVKDPKASYDYTYSVGMIDEGTLLYITEYKTIETYENEGNKEASYVEDASEMVERQIPVEDYKKILTIDQGIVMSEKSEYEMIDMYLAAAVDSYINHDNEGATEYLDDAMGLIKSEE